MIRGLLGKLGGLAGGLLGGLSGLQWAALALVALLGGWVLVLRAEVGAATAALELTMAQRDQALEAAARNARAANEIARHAQSVQTALGSEMAAAQARADSLQSILMEIANVEDGTACAGSPAVRAALEHLADRVFQPP